MRMKLLLVPGELQRETLILNAELDITRGEWEDKSVNMTEILDKLSMRWKSGNQVLLNMANCNSVVSTMQESNAKLLNVQIKRHTHTPGNTEYCTCGPKCSRAKVYCMTFSPSPTLLPNVANVSAFPVMNAETLQ